jgi:phosphohistidine phosphatase SixA
MKYLITLLLISIFPVTSAFGADATAPSVPVFVEKAMSADLMEKVRKGGYVLYMRHGYTDNSRPDRVPSVDLNDCNTQRPLSDAGRELMKKVGMAMREAKIPVSRVLVSPMCRTKESARLLIGEKFEIVESLMYSANMTSEEKKPRIEALKKLMLEPVPAGGNTLLVAHAPNMADLIGFFVKPEGNLLVFRQDGAGGFEYLASIQPDAWVRLAR